MPTFITYGSFSSQGCKGLLSKPEDRAVALAPLFERAGGKIKALYFTTGSHDVVVVSEFADGTDGVAVGMAVAASGAMSNLETVRAWDSAEFVDVIKNAGTLAGSYSPPGS